MSDHHKKHHGHAHEKHEEPVIEEAVVETEPVEEMQQAAPATPGLQPVWPLFKETFSKWQRHWKVFTGIEIIWAAVSLGTVILGAMAGGFAFASSNLFKSGMAPEQMTTALFSNAGALAVLIIGIVIVAAILLIVSTWMSLAAIKAWGWVSKGEHDQVTVRRAYAETWSLVPGYIWISILALALLALGFIGLVIPGIMLALAFTLLTSIVVMERPKGRHAIMRATRMARPYLLTIFWRVLVTCILIYVPGEILAAILNEMSDGLGDAVNQLYGLVVSPILTGVLFATYLEIKAADRKQKYLVWLSLERMALIGALIAAVAIGCAVLWNTL